MVLSSGPVASKENPRDESSTQTSGDIRFLSPIKSSSDRGPRACDGLAQRSTGSDIKVIGWKENVKRRTWRRNSNIWMWRGSSGRIVKRIRSVLSGYRARWRLTHIKGPGATANSARELRVRSPSFILFQIRQSSQPPVWIPRQSTNQLFVPLIRVE